MQKTIAFDVFLNRKKIDTVFYTVRDGASVLETAAEVRRGLIHHDGYDPAIVVRKRREH